MDNVLRTEDITAYVPEGDRDPERRDADTRALRGEAACAVGDPDWSIFHTLTGEEHTDSDEAAATIANVLHYVDSEYINPWDVIDEAVRLFERDRA
jgi:hypothetical protein